MLYGIGYVTHECILLRLQAYISSYESSDLHNICTAYTVVGHCILHYVLPVGSFQDFHLLSILGQFVFVHRCPVERGQEEGV